MFAAILFRYTNRGSAGAIATGGRDRLDGRVVRILDDDGTVVDRDARREQFFEFDILIGRLEFCNKCCHGRIMLNNKG